MSFSVQMGLLRYLRWLLHGPLFPQMLLHCETATPENRGVLIHHSFGDGHRLHGHLRGRQHHLRKAG